MGCLGGGVAFWMQIGWLDDRDVALAFPSISISISTLYLLTRKVDETMSVIEQLQEVLIERKRNPKVGSYTNVLLSNEEELVKKVGEEAVEVILAAVKQGNERLISETADLVYHLLVLLTTHDVMWADVEAELGARRKGG